MTVVSRRIIPCSHNNGQIQSLARFVFRDGTGRDVRSSRRNGGLRPRHKLHIGDPPSIAAVSLARRFDAKATMVPRRSSELAPSLESTQETERTGQKYRDPVLMTRCPPRIDAGRRSCISTDSFVPSVVRASRCTLWLPLSFDNTTQRPTGGQVESIVDGTLGREEHTRPMLSIVAVSQ